MKRTVWLAPLLVLLLSSPLCAAEAKIGFIDLQAALNKCEAGQAAKEKIGGKVKEYEGVIDQRQKELKKLKDDLEKQALLLSEDARGAKERDYQQKLKDFQRFTKDIQEELQERDAEFTKSILTDMTKIIAEVGAKDGFTVILEKTESAILYADDKIDLTERIIKAYDASRKKP